MQGNLKYPRIKKIEVLEKKQLKQKRPKSFVSYELLSTKIYYTSIGIFYILFTSRQVQEFKNYQKIIKYIKCYMQNNLNILLNLFSICNTFEFKVTQISGEPVTQHTCQSHANASHMKM